VALATGRPVIVTLPADRPLRDAALAGLAVTRVRVPDAVEGIAASLRAGLAAAGAGAVLILLADLPEITTDDLLRVLKRHSEAPERILRAMAEDGTPGHPVLFPAWALPELAAMSGDAGAREVLRRHAKQVYAVPLPGRHAVTDLDTPEDWAAWRAG
jgi:CTP:molybdopterin cytidylyltransferase MocA